jgi:hypothetical protein
VSCWKRSQEAVEAYLAERIAHGIKPAAPVFDGSYDTTKEQLTNLIKVLDPAMIHRNHR